MKGTKRSGAVLSGGSTSSNNRKSRAKGIGYEDEDDQFVVDGVDEIDPDARGGGYDSSGQKEGDPEDDSEEAEQPKRSKLDYSA